MTTLDESLILTLMCGIKVCDYITCLILTLMCGIKVCDYIGWKPDIDINVWYKGVTTLDESLILTLMCGIKVCDYIKWKPDIDINV